MLTMTYQESCNFVSALYILFLAVVMLYIAYKLYKEEYMQQALMLMSWMSVVSVFVVMIMAYTYTWR